VKEDIYLLWSAMSCSVTPRRVAVSDIIPLAEESEGGDSAEADGHPWR
jgi:hypothetical protein